MSLPGWMADELRRVNATFGTASVVVTPRASLNDYAEGVDGTPVTYSAARIEGKVQQIRTATGEEVTSMQTVDLNGTASVSPDDRATLPDGSEQLVLAVQVLHLGSETVTTRLFL